MFSLVFSRSTDKIWFKGGDASCVTTFSIQTEYVVQIFYVDLLKRIRQSKINSTLVTVPEYLSLSVLGWSICSFKKSSLDSWKFLMSEFKKCKNFQFLAIFSFACSHLNFTQLIKTFRKCVIQVGNTILKNALDKSRHPSII